MSTPGTSNDSKAASIAWAIATIVVALVIGLIAWLAMKDGGNGNGDDGNAAPAATSPTSTPDKTSAPDETSAPASEPTEDQSAQTPPPEVKQMMLDLQRRDADDKLAIGDVDAPVVMIEYADYRCPYCAKFHLQIRPELQSLVDDGTLRIEFRDFVIFDQPSHDAAVAARAAGEQDLFADYQKALFARSEQGQAELTKKDFVALAKEVGVPDLEAFEKALGSKKLDDLVTADTEEARSIGISSTPTMLINTAVVQGAYEAEHMKKIIEQEKATAQQDS